MTAAPACGATAWAVITAGAVAIAAAVKAKVTLVEAHKMGGDCLNYGCVPSKALIAAGVDLVQDESALLAIRRRVEATKSRPARTTTAPAFPGSNIEPATSTTGAEAGGFDIGVRRYAIVLVFVNRTRMLCTIHGKTHDKGGKR